MADTPKVYAAIAAVAGALSEQGIGKEQKNKAQGYDFRGIDDLYNVLGPILADQELSILPRVLSRETIEGKTAKGTVSFHTILDVEFDIVSAADGSMHTVRTQGEALDTSDKSVNKALIAAYKYLVFIMFCIPVKGMADADKDSPEVAESSRGAPKADPDELIGTLIKEIESTKDGKLGLDEMWAGEFDNAKIGDMTIEGKRAFYKALTELKSAMEDK